MARGPREGTVYKRKHDGIWCGQITLGTNPETGKQLRKSFYGNSSREVQRKMTEAKAKYLLGQARDSKRISFGEWIETWLEIYKKPRIKVKYI